MVAFFYILGLRFNDRDVGLLILRGLNPWHICPRLVLTF